MKNSSSFLYTSCKIKLNYYYKDISFIIIKHTLLMEKNINQKISNFVNHFKEDIVEKVKEYSKKDCDLADLLSFIYNKECLQFSKQDMHKRKRIKNSVPFHERCRAVRANCEQCTRRKRDGFKFCGTHIKGTPHGEINDSNESKEPETVKIMIWAQEISGIIHHLDEKGNVYDPQDIFENKKNPKVIAHYVKNGDKYRLSS